MSSKGLIWGGMFAGSLIGSLLPMAWGGGLMAYTLWSAIGGVAGIWAGFKISRNLG